MSLQCTGSPPDVARSSMQQGASAGTRRGVGQSILLVALLFCTHLTAAGALQEVTDFGDNPAALRMLVHVPAGMPATAPLVVALHGCAQQATTYADAGWLDYADDRKFYVVLPEQSAFERMTNSCWSWFRAADTTRGSGQAASILAMIGWMRRHYGIDARRIYADGLSAGGWLVPELLAAYPDVFAGGSVHAGGPAYCASVVRPFWDWFGWWTNATGSTLAAICMQGEQLDATTWAQRARAASPAGWHGGWPVLSIWHGDDDYIVSPRNQQQLLEQWTALHDTDRTPDRSGSSGPRDRIRHQTYVDARGRAVVETWQVAGMTHGIAIDGASGARCGSSSAFVLDVGVCAVRRIGDFWGL